MTIQPDDRRCSQCHRADSTLLIWTGSDHACIAHHITGDCEATTSRLEEFARTMAEHMEWSDARHLDLEIIKRRQAEGRTTTIQPYELGIIATRDWRITAKAVLTADTPITAHPYGTNTLIWAHTLTQGTHLTVTQNGKYGQPVTDHWYTGDWPYARISDPTRLDILDVINDSWGPFPNPDIAAPANIHRAG